MGFARAMRHAEGLPGKRARSGRAPGHRSPRAMARAAGPPRPQLAHPGPWPACNERVQMRFPGPAPARPEVIGTTTPAPGHIGHSKLHMTRAKNAAHHRLVSYARSPAVQSSRITPQVIMRLKAISPMMSDSTVANDTMTAFSMSSPNIQAYSLYSPCINRTHRDRVAGTYAFELVSAAIS